MGTKDKISLHFYNKTTQYKWDFHTLIKQILAHNVHQPNLYTSGCLEEKKKKKFMHHDLTQTSYIF